MIKIFSETINIQEVIHSASSEKAGAIDIFIGTVRNHSLQKEVIKLEYETYDRSNVHSNGTKLSDSTSHILI